MPMVVRLEAVNILDWLIGGVEKVPVWEHVEYLVRFMVTSFIHKSTLEFYPYHLSLDLELVLTYRRAQLI